MATEVLLSQLGYDMAEGTVVQWLKNEGDHVAQGEPIVEIETDKVTVEIEAETSGILRRVVAPEGSTIPTGQVLAYIGTADEPIPDVATPRAELVTPAKAPPPRAVPGAPSIRGVPAPPLPDAEGRIPLGDIRQAIARRTQGTMRDVPHYYVTVSVDMTRAVEFRHELNRSLTNGARVSVNDMIVKASALALVRFPLFNSTFQGDHLQVSPRVNVGIVIALADGLIVPAVLGCERKSLVEIAAAAKDLGRRAKGGKLQREEYTGGTFSVSNLGMFDVDSFTAIIFSPQAAVLAVGAVHPAPVVRDGEIVVRQMMQATFSADHRVGNGGDTAQFAMEIKRLLEDPAQLGGGE